MPKAKTKSKSSKVAEKVESIFHPIAKFFGFSLVKTINIQDTVDAHIEQIAESRNWRN